MDGNMKMQRSSYGRFGAMIVTSTIVMFVLMYLNSYALDHVFYSQTRTWMAVYMGAAMAIVMLGFMWSMYKDRRKNAAIIAASIKTGRASCRERVCQYVWRPVVAGSLQKKEIRKNKRQYIKQT